MPDELPGMGLLSRGGLELPGFLPCRAGPNWYANQIQVGAFLACADSGQGAVTCKYRIPAYTGGPRSHMGSSGRRFKSRQPDTGTLQVNAYFSRAGRRWIAYLLSVACANQGGEPRLRPSRSRPDT
jgi:hypothetical protein